MKKFLGAAAVATVAMVGAADMAVAAPVVFNIAGTSPTVTFVAPSTTVDITVTESQPNYSLTSLFVDGQGPGMLTKVMPNFSAVFLEAMNLVVGTTYTLTIGTSGSSAVGYVGQISSVNTVPLPGSVAMLGTALAGLGAYGVMRRKGKVAPTPAV